jgi:hypothetical protein
VYALFAQLGNPNNIEGFAKSAASGRSGTTINNGIPGSYSFRSLAVAANSDLYAGFANPLHVL